MSRRTWALSRQGAAPWVIAHLKSDVERLRSDLDERDQSVADSLVVYVERMLGLIEGGRQIRVVAYSNGQDPSGFTADIQITLFPDLAPTG